MKTYSIMLMRRERIPTLSLIVLCAGICLTFAAYYGALWMVGKEISLILTGVCFLLFMFFVGLYFLATDEKRLLRKTLYGRALMQYAMKNGPFAQQKDAEKAAMALMNAIDREAQSMLYECSGFALMEQWIILYGKPPVSSIFKGALTAHLVPREAIRRITWKAAGKEENSGFQVRIWVEGNPEPHRILTYEQASIQALRQWGASQEKQDL